MCWGISVCEFRNPCACVYVCWPSQVTVVCILVFLFYFLRCICAPAPFGLYPKAVLQAYETSEREWKSLGRLWDISWEHLSRLRILQQSQRKLTWSLMKLLWGPGRARPSLNHWFRVSKVFFLLMLKASSESRVIWPQICDYKLHDGLWRPTKLLRRIDGDRIRLWLYITL